MNIYRFYRKFPDCMYTFCEWSIDHQVEKFWKIIKSSIRIVESSHILLESRILVAVYIWWHATCGFTFLLSNNSEQ